MNDGVTEMVFTEFYVTEIGEKSCFDADIETIFKLHGNFFSNLCLILNSWVHYDNPNPINNYN